MNGTDKDNRRGAIGVLAIALAVVFAVLLVDPGLGKPAAGVGLVAAIALSILALTGRRRASESPRGGVGEAGDDKVLSLLRKSKDHQEELASQVQGTIILAGRISDILTGTMDAVGTFQNEFKEGGNSVGAIRDLVDRFESQVSQLTLVSQQAAAASEEMAASIERMSTESSARYDEIKDLADLSRDGQMEMRSSLDIIRKVVSSVDTLNGFIASINDIADRTSLLAMNAAIQAAHAGEAGRGFAVVAGEVRKLAASSSESAQAISGRLADLIQSIRKAEESSVNSAGVFATVEERVRRATDSFLEIRNGTGELAAAGREIRDVVASTKNASDQINVATNEVTTEVRSLEKRFRNLQDEADKIVGNLMRIQSNAGEINLNSLATAQSDVEQLRVSASVLEASGLSEEDSSSLGTILKLQHLAWVARVWASIDGQFHADRAKAADYENCELGVWLSTAAPREIKDSGLLRDLEAKHKDLHVKAAATLDAIEAGRKKEAAQRSADLSKDSEAIVELIAAVFRARRPSFMSWNKNYVVGNATIDGQHRHLVDLINELADAMDGGKGREALGGVLEELVEYTATHFKDEERIFVGTEYPFVKAHREQHESLTQQVFKLRDQFRSGANVLSADTLSFLREWLNGHILGTDKGYAPYLKA